jgi:hypothetical protein
MRGGGLGNLPMVSMQKMGVPPKPGRNSHPTTSFHGTDMSKFPWNASL